MRRRVVERRQRPPARAARGRDRRPIVGGGYALTAHGRELLEALEPLGDWAQRWARRREASRRPMAQRRADPYIAATMSHAAPPRPARTFSTSSPRRSPRSGAPSARSEPHTKGSTRRPPTSSRRTCSAPSNRLRPRPARPHQLRRPQRPARAQRSPRRRRPAPAARRRARRPCRRPRPATPTTRCRRFRTRCCPSMSATRSCARTSRGRARRSPRYRRRPSAFARTFGR